MLKKELYEYCKTLITENQKLQLFNNSQEEEIEKINKNYIVECEISGKELKEGIEKLEQEIEELKESDTYERKENCILTNKIYALVDKINSLEQENERLEQYQSLANNYADETQTNGYGDYIGSVETLEKYIEELQEKIKTQKYNCLIKYETDIKQKDICIEKYQLKNQALEKDLEYFQNKCEIMEKELIEEEEKTILFEMVQNLTEESAKKEDTIIKLEKDNKKLQESIVELEAVILSKPNIFYFSYYDEEHIFYDNIEDLVTNTPHIEDCYVYEGNVTKEDIKSNHNDFGESWSVEIDYMVKK